MKSVKDLANYNPGVQPCGHRVVVYPIPVEKTTASGIIIHEKVGEREDMAQIEAIVVAVGPAAYYDQPGHRPWCQPGDKVLIAKYSGLYRTGLDQKQYRIISDLDVVAVVQEDEAD